MARTGIMLAKPFEERLLEKMSTPYLIQRKINGERCVAHISETGIDLRSSEDNHIATVPHIVEELMELGLPYGKYDGELYIHGWKIGDIHSVVSSVRKEVHSDHEKVTFNIFDMNIENLPQLDRVQYLRSILHDTPHIHRVETFPTTAKQIPEITKVFLDEGYEGSIIRDPNGMYEEKKTAAMLKIKPRFKDEYIIVGSLEEISIHGEPKNALGAFVCRKDNQEFKVGSGRILTKANRELLWKEKDKLLGKTLIVKYPELTARGVPFQGVAYDII
jgi:ATP-dependent DNA ligase